MCVNVHLKHAGRIGWHHFECMFTCVCENAHVFVSVYCWSVFRAMGWLQLVGSLKLQVSFAEYSLFYRALLQKRPIILRSLLIVATPYVCVYREHAGLVGWQHFQTLCVCASVNACDMTCSCVRRNSCICMA